MKKYKILFAGNYEIDYNRTKIIKTGLIKLGHKVIEFKFKEKNNKNREIIKTLASESDVIFCPFASHKQVSFIKKAVDKPVIFDPLISLYMTHVFDYKDHSKYSIDAILYYFHDLNSLRSADFIITDTKQNLKYYHEKYKIPISKMESIYIGNNFDEFYPCQSKQKNYFTVGFYGSFAPLHGIDSIVITAKKLSNIKEIIFEIIGDGFEMKKIKKIVDLHKIHNIRFLPKLKADELKKKINDFDVALGIFGKTIKANMVIPNKIFHYCACKKPVITKETDAVKEIFVNTKDIILTSSEPDDIAEKIIYLKNNPYYAEKIAENAYSKIKNEYNEIKIAEKFLDICRKII